MSQKNVAVTVVIPTYNRAEIVTKAIDSVLAQTYQDYEIIVVDDGSTDNTGKLLTKRYGKRIRYIYQPNAGVSAARNKGVDASGSDLVAFLDSDDFWLPRKLEVQLPLMSDPDVVLSYTNWSFDTNPDKDHFSAIGLSFEHDGNIFSEPIALYARLRAIGATTSAVICRKSVLSRIGGFDERLKVFEDVRAWFRLAMEGKFAATSETLLVRCGSDTVERLSRSSYSFFKEATDAQLETFLECYARAIDSAPDVQKGLRKEVACYLTRQSQYLALDGNYGMARRKAFESLVFGPRGKSALRAIVGLILPRAFHFLGNCKKKSALSEEAESPPGE